MFKRAQLDCVLFLLCTVLGRKQIRLHDELRVLHQILEERPRVVLCDDLSKELTHQSTEVYGLDLREPLNRFHLLARLRLEFVAKQLEPLFIVSRVSSIYCMRGPSYAFGSLRRLEDAHVAEYVVHYARH
jgi:hypothetical protein